MLIKGLQKLTLLDYPKKVAATIFLFGCNFRCPYCHNPELIEVSKKDIKKTKNYSEKEILDFLHERKGFLEGVCITGGEPTINPELPEFIKKIKDLGYKVKLDTNGTNPEMLKKLIKENIIDYVAMDIKAPLARYEKVTQSKVNTSAIKESIEIIRNFTEHEFRITVVPKLITEKDVIEIAKMLEGSKAFYLQQFRPENCLDEKYNKEKPCTKEQLEEIREKIKPYFKKVEIRTETY